MHHKRVFEDKICFYEEVQSCNMETHKMPLVTKWRVRKVFIIYSVYKNRARRL